MNLQEIKDRLGAINNRVKVVLDTAKAEDRGLSEDESKEVDSILAEADDLKIKVAEHQRLERVATLDSYMSQPATPKVMPGDPNAGVQPQASEYFQPSPSLKPRISMTNHHGGLKVFNKGEKDLLDAYRIGRFFDAAFNGNPKSMQWCRENGINYQDAHLESVNTAGGIFVPEEMSSRIIDLRDQFGVFRRNTFIEPMGSASKVIARRKSGLTAYHVGEGGTTTESTAAWDDVGLTARKVSVYSKMSEELEEDSIINFADRLTMEAGYAMAVREDNDGFLGDGTSTYGGMTGLFPGIIGTAGAVDVATVGHDTMVEIDSTDITTLMATLPQYASLMGPKWYMSKFAYDQVVGRLSLAGGGNTISDFAEGWRPRFMGYPVEISEVLPGTGTINETGMIAFGNLDMASTLGDRRGIRVKISDEILFATDEIALKFTERYHIVNHNIGTAAAAGPIVVLIGDTS